MHNGDPGEQCTMKSYSGYLQYSAPGLAVLALVLLYLFSFPNVSAESSSPKMATIDFNGKTIRAVIADTPKSRIQGLLGWSSIEEHTGMLLDFLTDSPGAIHMEGMKFPIDALWIDSTGEIRVVYDSIQPDKGLIYPSIFPCRYCLEVQAGFCKKYDIKIGRKVRFKVD
jgi:uncharacterized membrane protein (UPF0127 family)